MLKLDEEMKRVKARVDALILDTLLPKGSGVPEIDLLYRMMRDYPERPAKGLRPFLCVTTCKAAGGREEDALLTAACIELFQHWILIHDDIEDESELRRGQPTLHLKHSTALALNTGDALHARMWGALLRNQEALGSDRTLKVMSEFSRVVDSTTEGQHMELGWVRGKRWDLKESDYYEMCTRKTSSYTVAGPCRLGAIVAGSAPEVLDGLLDYGTDLGVAFQIQDDVLNLVGDKEKYGKATSDDILEGKRTLILLHALERANSGERARVISIMNKDRGRKSGSDVSYVLSIIEKYDAVGYSRNKALHLLDESLSILHGIRWKGDRDSADLLESFSKFAVERQW